MDPLLLTDPAVVPTEEALFAIIGPHRAEWKSLLAGIAERFPEAAGEWNYYRERIGKISCRFLPGAGIPFPLPSSDNLITLPGTATS